MGGQIKYCVSNTQSIFLYVNENIFHFISYFLFHSQIGILIIRLVAITGFIIGIFIVTNNEEERAQGL